MRERSESWVFALTAASAVSVLVSIAVSQILLGLACLVWVVFRPRPLYIPPYFVPLFALMASTLLSLAFSEDPSVGAPPVRKFVVFAMGLLTVNFVTSVPRARGSYGALVVVAAGSSSVAIAQFLSAYQRFRITGDITDDPTVLARATGFMGHWMTFSGEQLLVWCAVVPAILVLGYRWVLPLSIVSVGLLLSFTRSAWLGAIAAVSVLALTMPRKFVVALLVPLFLVGALASPLVYRRITMTFSEGFAPDSGRIALLVAGVEMIQDHPIVGVGPERIVVEFPAYYEGENLDSFFYGHMHNNFMQIAAERGLLALAAFLWFLVKLYSGLVSLARGPDPTIRFAVLGALAALTGFLVAGLFEFNFGDSEVLTLFLFIVSIPFGLGRAPRSDVRG